MRTLKKTLSLVLVVAMVLGLCVVGASAKDKVESFTDDYQKVGAAYQEAVGVLVGVGIIDGMTETALEPQGNYTREQAAKIIAYMLLGKSKADSLKCTVAPFDDVAASRWSAGYIAFCVEQGIIDGMTATTYEPTGTLTGFQWAKMLLCAIGFGVKGEFTGSSWSVNTALVAHKVNLFAGDLDGADHTALRREQAALYAFNALKTAKVAYSPNVTSYVYGIQGYTTVNNIGSTLAKDVYDLKYAQGIIVDVEGNGAGYTVVSKDYSTANVTNKIKADNDIDMMYHAARVWYTGTNTGVYTYDLAKTTAYQCQEIPTGSKAATAANAKALTIGEANNNAAKPYEAYLVDNSAIGAGSAYVTVYATYGQLGYIDTVKKTVTAVGREALASNVRTDISNIKYGAPVVLIYTSSTTETTTATAHGMYIYAATSTVGTVKSVSKANGVVSVTLTDGTVLKESNLVGPDNIDEYVIGNVYTFVLDSHGHIIYATKDYARTLWAYAGDYKYTNEYSAISSDWVKAYRFINVSTGEVAYYPIYDESVLTNNTADYYDISATATASGKYVAKQITKGQNTYAAGYIVDDFTVVRNTSSSSVYEYVATTGTTTGTVYFDGATVTFLVASGTGANMKVTPYTGIQAFKTAYNVASNGTMYLENTAMTVSRTSTGAWNASVIFVFETNLSAVSRYVFIPTDIDSSDWTTLSGDPAGLYATYDGAYLEGKKVPVSFSKEQIEGGNSGFTGGKLYRGFYIMHVDYTTGVARYVLDERVDNGRFNDCYYLGVKLEDTGNNTTKTWYLKSGLSKYEARDGEVTIVDTTAPNYAIGSLYDLYVFMEGHKDWSLAFTVNPDTNRVDYIYVVNVGWDATINFALTDALKAAGWVIKSIDGVDMPANTTSKTYTDAAAEAMVNKPIAVVLYNEKLQAVTTKSTAYDLKVNGVSVTDGVKLASGTLTTTVTPVSMALNAKTQDFVFGGLEMSSVTLKLSDTLVASDLKFATGADTKFEKFVLGTTLTSAITPEYGTFKLPDGKTTVPSNYVWHGNYDATNNTGVKITGFLNSSSTVITFTLTPWVTGDITINSNGYTEPANP